MDAPFVLVALNGKVFALGRDDGRRAWTFEERSTHTPRVVAQQGYVLVLGESLACLEYATGRVLWRAQPGACAYGTLLADGDRVLVAGGGEVAAFDLAHGRRLWHEPFRGEGSGAVGLATPGAAAQADRGG